MATVLLVDDDGSVLLTLAIALRRRGHSVIVACDGVSALAHARRNPPEVVVSDVRMPGMNGFELAHRLRKLPQPPRIILTSAYSNMPPLGKDIDAFLQKPIDIDLLDSLLTDPRPHGGADDGGSLESDSDARLSLSSNAHIRPNSPKKNRIIAPAPRFRVPAVG